jgi:ribose 5-phosphate isomerase B
MSLQVGEGEYQIVVGADHGGAELKEALVTALREQGRDVVDVGTSGPTSVDYPDFARVVAGRVSRREAERGILLCTNGIGMAIAANKFPGVRAALVGDTLAARMAREHNDANVLVLGGGMTGKFHARELVRVFLETEFAGGRHQRRIDKIADIEREVGMRPEAGALR